MSKKMLWAFGPFCVLLMLALSGISSRAQSSDVKEKPPMYSYTSQWAIPRAHWADMQKASAAVDAILEKALADGTLLGLWP